jgi:hypothetical protein
MTDDAFLGNMIGAGVTLMVADRIFRPRYRTVYRTRRRTVRRRKRR